MAPTGKGGSPSEKLAKAIDESFGSMDDFKADGVRTVSGLCCG